jgi:hypothetical protein
MLTGELPVGRFAPPSERVAVDVRFDEVVLKSLEKDPRRRYQRASDLKTEVDALSGSSPAAAEPYQMGLAAARAAARAPALALLLAGLVTFLASLGLGLWSSWQCWRLATAPRQASSSQQGGMTITVTPQPGQPSAWPYGILAGVQLLAAAGAGLTLLAAALAASLQRYPLVRLGCFAALVPWSPGFLLGLPAGLWGLAVLGRPDVRQAFDRAEPAAGEAPLAAARWLHQCLATSSGLVLAALLAGALSSFLPWGRVSIFGVRFVQAGFEFWHGVVVAVVLALGLVVLAVATAAAPPLAAAFRLGTAAVAGGVALVIPAAFLWSIWNPPAVQVSEPRITGDAGLADAFGGLAQTMAQSMASAIGQAPAVGPFLTAGLGLVLLGLAARDVFRRRAPD